MCLSELHMVRLALSLDAERSTAPLFLSAAEHLDLSIRFDAVDPRFRYDDVRDPRLATKHHEDIRLCGHAGADGG